MVLTVGLLLFGEAGRVLGQAALYDWSAPRRLSGYQGVYRSHSHALATDMYGYIHAFWVEDFPTDGGTTIQYARFNGNSWSYPVDIYVTYSQIDALAATVDHTGGMHLLWSEGGNYRRNPIFYMRAQAYDAGSARHWSQPIQISLQADLFNFAVDSSGVLHLLYTEFFEPQAGVYYVRSEDGGSSWSEPVWLDKDIPSGWGPGSLKFVLDEADRLHVVWHYVPTNSVGGDWVRYAQSADHGFSWSEPFSIDRDTDGLGTLSFPGPLLAVSGQTVHVVWAGGTLNYRNHRFSLDGGLTWSAPARIFGALNGQAGDTLVPGRDGRVHFLGQIRYPQGIYYAYWSEGSWTAPVLIYLITPNSQTPIGNHLHAHGLELVLRGGEQLVLVFYDNNASGVDALYEMHTVLKQGTVLDLQPIPSVVPAPATELAPASTLQAAPSPTADHRLLGEAETRLPDRTPSPDSPIWIATIATAVLVGGVALIESRRRH